MHIVLSRREALDVPDGINIFIYTLADALQELGHRVTLVSSAVSDLKKIGEYYPFKQWPAVVSVGSQASVQYRHSLVAWLRNGKHVLRRLQPDLTIINGAVPVRLPGLTCTVSHDAEKRLERYPYFRNAFKRLCYSKSEMIVATCTEVQSALSADLGVPANRINVIPTCVNLNSYTNRPLAGREDAILHIGTVDYKNPAASVNAFARACTNGQRLYITGKPTDELKALVQSQPAAVRQRIELLGYVSAERLNHLLGTVRIVSVPSTYSTPVASPTVIEALASGTPVVASPSISRQVLLHERNGFVRDPADFAGMARDYQGLLNQPGTWERVSAAAFESAQAFCSRRVAKMYLDAAFAENQKGMAACKQ